MIDFFVQTFEEMKWKRNETTNSFLQTSLAQAIESFTLKMK